MIKGVLVSEGYAIGKILKINDIKIDYRKKSILDPIQEIKLFKHAIHLSKQQLNSLKDETRKRLGDETSHIFDAHMMMAEDPEFIQSVEKIIQDEVCNLSYAIKMVVDHFVDLFMKIDDDYLKERSKDIVDVSQRIIKNALGLPIVDYATIDHEVIVVAKDIKPSEAAQMNPKYVLGFITEEGGKTSHSAIIARLLGIPAIVGAKDILSLVTTGQEIIMDAVKGEIKLSIDRDMKHHYLRLIDILRQQKMEFMQYKGKHSSTLDHHKFELSANIVSSRDIEHVMQFDADGIGLFRTEFMFLDRMAMPSEEEQFIEYKKVLEAMAPKPVVIRTLDIGGDKHVPYLHLEKEDNPFLGNRAIRLCFQEIEIFKTQLHALLRASAFGNLKIMFPMIATKEEFLKAKKVVIEVQQELEKSGIIVKPYELGIMVEIPSAALSADSIASVVDFFSIGTNDLIQYTFAADRMKESLEYLYQPFNPALLKLIKMVADAAKRHQIWAGVCGEMASDLLAGPLLIGLGIHELSMTPASILKMRAVFSKLNYEDLKQLASNVLELESEEQVIHLLKQKIQQ